MHCDVFYFLNNEVKEVEYQEFRPQINQIVSNLNTLNWNSLVSEHSNTIKGNRSINPVLRRKVFRLLSEVLDYQFVDRNMLDSKNMSTFQIFENLGINNRLYYQCFKDDIYITYTTDNIIAVENKIFKNLLIREYINKNAVSVIITMGKELHNLGGVDSTSISYEATIEYLKVYKNFINFPIVLIGLFP